MSAHRHHEGTVRHAKADPTHNPLFFRTGSRYTPLLTTSGGVAYRLADRNQENVDPALSISTASPVSSGGHDLPVTYTDEHTHTTHKDHIARLHQCSKLARTQLRIYHAKAAELEDSNFCPSYSWMNTAEKAVIGIANAIHALENIPNPGDVPLMIKAARALHKAISRKIAQASEDFGHVDDYEECHRRIKDSLSPAVSTDSSPAPVHNVPPVDLQPHGSPLLKHNATPQSPAGPGSTSSSSSSSGNSIGTVRSPSKERSRRNSYHGSPAKTNSFFDNSDPDYLPSTASEINPPPPDRNLRPRSLTKQKPSPSLPPSTEPSNALEEPVFPTLNPPSQPLPTQELSVTSSMATLNYELLSASQLLPPDAPPDLPTSVMGGIYPAPDGTIYVYYGHPQYGFDSDLGPRVVDRSELHERFESLGPSDSGTNIPVRKIQQTVQPPATPSPLTSYEPSSETKKLFFPSEQTKSMAPSSLHLSYIDPPAKRSEPVPPVSNMDIFPSPLSSPIITHPELKKIYQTFNQETKITSTTLEPPTSSIGSDDTASLLDSLSRQQIQELQELQFRQQEQIRQLEQQQKDLLAKQQERKAALEKKIEERHLQREKEARQEVFIAQAATLFQNNLQIDDIPTVEVLSKTKRLYSFPDMVSALSWEKYVQWVADEATTMLAAGCKHNAAPWEPKLLEIFTDKIFESSGLKRPTVAPTEPPATTVPASGIKTETKKKLARVDDMDEEEDRPNPLQEHQSWLRMPDIKNGDQLPSRPATRRNTIKPEIAAYIPPPPGAPAFLGRMGPRPMPTPPNKPPAVPNAKPANTATTEEINKAKKSQSVLDIAKVVSSSFPSHSMTDQISLVKTFANVTKVMKEVDEQRRKEHRFLTCYHHHLSRAFAPVPCPNPLGDNKLLSMSTSRFSILEDADRPTTPAFSEHQPVPDSVTDLIHRFFDNRNQGIRANATYDLLNFLMVLIKKDKRNLLIERIIDDFSEEMSPPCPEPSAHTHVCNPVEPAEPVTITHEVIKEVIKETCPTSCATEKANIRKENSALILQLRKELSDAKSLLGNLKKQGQPASTGDPPDTSSAPTRSTEREKGPLRPLPVPPTAKVRFVNNPSPKGKNAWLPSHSYASKAKASPATTPVPETVPLPQAKPAPSRNTRIAKSCTRQGTKATVLSLKGPDTASDEHHSAAPQIDLRKLTEAINANLMDNKVKHTSWTIHGNLSVALERPVKDEHQTAITRVYKGFIQSMEDVEILNVSTVSFVKFPEVPLFGPDGTKYQTDDFERMIKANPKWHDTVFTYGPTPIFKKDHHSDISATLKVGFKDDRNSSHVRKLLTTTVSFNGALRRCRPWIVGHAARQCHLCLRWGHSAHNCRSVSAYCAFCAGNHPTDVHHMSSNASHQAVQCINCKQAHIATSQDCPWFRARYSPQELNKLKEARTRASAKRRTRVRDGLPGHDQPLLFEDIERELQQRDI